MCAWRRHPSLNPARVLDAEAFAAEVVVTGETATIALPVTLVTLPVWRRTG